MSVPLRSGMVHWPSDPPVEIERTRRLERGDTCNFSTLSMGAHTGTHMDAPLHFLPRGAALDRMPFSATLGPARVVAIRDPESIKPDELRRHHIRRGGRVLFKTRNSERCWPQDAFVEDFVFISHRKLHRRDLTDLTPSPLP